jgi:hypothetical protein
MRRVLLLTAGLVGMEAGNRWVVAQTLIPGIWTGMFTPPNGESVPVRLTVTATIDSSTLTLIAPDGNELQFRAEGLQLREDGLHFGWTADPTDGPFACLLHHDTEQRYEGECLDLAGGVSKMALTPPRREP